jgi:hypothetical protein
MVIAHAAGLPAAGDEIVIALPADPADLLGDGVPPIRSLTAQVRSIERRVPASVFVTVSEGTGHE